MQSSDFSGRLKCSYIVPYTHWVIVELVELICVKCLKQCLARVLSAKRERRGRK